MTASERTDTECKRVAFLVERYAADGGWFPLPGNTYDTESFASARLTQLAGLENGVSYRVVRRLVHDVVIAEIHGDSPHHPEATP